MSRSHIVCLAGVLIGAAAMAQPAAATSPAAQVLLDQANYWRAQSKPQQAEEAVKRLLVLEPQNADALALAAQLAAERGDRTAAQRATDDLRRAHPDDPRVAAAEQALRTASIDPAGLTEARGFAQRGNLAEAVTRYKQLFRGSTPPASLATEYYETLAGTNGGWDPARAGLTQTVAANPQDLRAQLAYAQLLTYREETRASGIARLAALAQNPGTEAAANRAWRQALEWLPKNASAIPAYQAYLAVHPSDGAITALLNDAKNPVRTAADELGQQRAAGFTALEAGRLREAADAFQAVLARHADDADALGGLGLVRLRENHADEARTLLSRAIAADPAHKSRWEQALSGAAVGDEYAQARSMIARGQLEAAERQLRSIIAAGGETTGARSMLADVQSRRGDTKGAEASYRAVLSRQPANADALVGLARVLEREGRSQEASALLDRAQAAGDTRTVSRLKADSLRQQAAAASDATARIALLRAATAAAPADPWVRLDLARALTAADRKAEARQLMAELTDAGRPSTDALRAGALFAAEDNRPEVAASLIARLPPAARTPDMLALQNRAKLQGEVAAIASMASFSPGATREKLLTLAAGPDPDGSRGVAIATAFLRANNPAAAREALSTALAASPRPTPAQRLAYAGLLMQAGDDRGTQAMMRSLSSPEGLTVDQMASLRRLRAGLAIRTADALNADGKQADAYEVLAPELARNPDDADLNMAVARLYARADKPQRALAINAELLGRDPRSMDARRGAFDAAVQLHDWDRANRLVQEGMQIASDDPRVWTMAADLHRARGNNAAAMADLKRALALRQQEIGADLVSTRAAASRDTYAPGAREAYASPVGSLSVPPPGALSAFPATTRPVSAYSDANPFGPSASSPATGVERSPFDTSTTVDPMSADIGRQMSELNNEMAPKLAGEPTLRMRTGSAGTDKLTEVSTPVQVLASPFGRGQLSVGASPTFLNAGDVGSSIASQRTFGSGALANKTTGSQHAEGVGLSVGYRLGWFNADVGTSPVGFQQQNILGGAEVSPEIAPGVRLRVTGERRSVTDSLLSYAGTTDPTSGVKWGGVTRTRGHAQLEFTRGLANFYVGGGYASVQGENVASNTEYEGGAGGTYQVWRSGDQEVRVGLDLVYFGYNKNLRYFTLGQGGYFSPQSYFAGLIPVRYTGKADEWNWSIGAAIGYQTYTERDSNVFPNSNAMQRALVAQAAGDPTIVTVYPGRNASGLVGNADGRIEYSLNPQMRIGARASYQHAGDWSEAQGSVYAKYIFNGDL